MAVRESVAAAVPPRPTPPSPDIELEALLTGSSSNEAANNDFDRVFANSPIPTACDDVRAPFPAEVAEMSCTLQRPGDRRRGWRRTAAFFGEIRGARSGRGRPDIVQASAPPSTQPMPTVPLPSRIALSATALGGLAIARRSRTARPAHRAGPV
ncbi:MAG: hypothetical protein ACLFTG_08155 [Alphaproteobacteria bacterium]